MSELGGKKYDSKIPDDRGNHGRWRDDTAAGCLPMLVLHTKTLQPL